MCTVLLPPSGNPTAVNKYISINKRYTANVQQKLSATKARCSAKCSVFKPERTPAVTLGYKKRDTALTHTAMSWRGSSVQRNYASTFSLYEYFGGRFPNSREVSVQSTAKEMIPATKLIDAHAQDLVEKSQVLLPILKAFAQSSRSQRATRNAWCTSIQLLCTRRTGWWLSPIAIF